jgi:putative phosphoribosyl transferase
MRFLDRVDAGRKLANLLRAYAHKTDVIVLGIPRGGIPVAYQVAAELGAPLDVFVVRKLGVPWQPELALGAIAGGSVQVIDAEIVESVGISRAEIDRIAAAENQELQRRERVYRGTRPPLHLAGKTVILVDDGIATGASTRAAITALREFSPGRIVLAAPVAPASTCKRLRRDVDDLVCLHAPESFYAIGEFYDDFTQVSDAEVTELLRLNREQRAQRIAGPEESGHDGVHP